MCSSFKQELLNGSHALGTQAANGVRTVTTKDVIKAALYLATATKDSTTTVYNNTGELAGTGGYTQTGITVTNANLPGLTSTTAFWTPSASLSWGGLTSSGSFDAVLFYNDSSTSKLAISVHTFAAQSITSGTFTLTMPSNDSVNGLLRIT